MLDIQKAAFNKRQLDLITKTITHYRCGYLSIPTLISNLTLVELLSDIPKNTLDELVATINSIDLVFATALDNNKNYLHDTEQHKINTFLKFIESFIKEYTIKNNLENFDEEYETYKQEYPDASTSNKK